MLEQVDGFGRRPCLDQAAPPVDLEVLHAGELRLSLGRVDSHVLDRFAVRQTYDAGDGGLRHDGAMCVSIIFSRYTLTILVVSTVSEYQAGIIVITLV